MPDASVNIGGDASGGLAAVAAMQGAIDGLHGKTVNLDVNTRGGHAAVAGMASDMGRVGDAADRAGRSARGMGEHFERAGRSARGMGDHVGRMADEASRLSNHLDAVNRIMGGGAPSSIGRASGGMRELANEADRARSSIGEIGSGSGGMRAIESGAAGAGRGFRAMGASAHGVSVEVMGVYRNTRQAITAAGEAGSAFSTASGHTSQMGSDLARMGDRASGAGKELARIGESSKGLERLRGTGGGALFGDNSLLKNMMGGLGAMDGLASKAGSAVSSMAGFGIAGGAVKGFGIAAGVSAIGMGALGAAVAGVGLAGVAEDFAHNSQLMNKGEQAVRGFNKEFRAMRSETSAAGMPAMDGLKTSIAGVGHELAHIGATNMAPTLNMGSQLAGSMTQAMRQLEPAIGPAGKALTSLGGAVVGALGQSSPAIASFANAVTQNSAGIQSGLTSTVSLMSNLGVMTAQMLGTAAPLIQGASNAAGFMADFSSGGIRQQSNVMGDPNATGSVDTGIPDGQGGTVKTPGASIGTKLGGALGAGATGLAAGAGIGFLAAGPPGALVGGTIMGVGSAIAGYTNAGAPENAPGAGAGAPTLGPIQSQKSMGLSSRPGRFGDFGPGSGGPMIPGGPTAAQSLTQQRADAGLPPVGQPMYNGLGPRGGGQSVGPMPASAAIGLGGGSIAPLNALSSAMTSQVAGGGAATGQGLVQHIQKAVQVASPAASAGGAAIGGAINAGTAQGSQSTQSVVDTVIIKHSKHIIDIASAALGIRSPSTEFDYLGRMTSAGYAQGIVRESHRAGTATVGLFGHAKSGYDYQDGSDPVISVRKQPSYDDFQAAQQAQQDAADRKASFGNRQGAYQPGSEGWWSAHDNRAGQLAVGRENRQRAAIGGMTHDERRDQLLQNRAGNHERALANLHISGHVDPRRDPNSAQNNVNPFVGTTRDPLAGIKGGAAGRFQGMYNQAGQASAMGLTQGMNAHVGKVQAAGAGLAGAGHGGYRKKDKQASPSAAWAEMAGNSVAGAVGGMNAGAPALAAAGAGAASAMAGPLNNQGLQIGYSFATNIVDGAIRTFKNTNLQASGTPQIANQQAAAALGRLGLYGAGAGASVYATPSVSESGAGVAAQIAAVVKAAVQSQPIHLTVNLEGAPFRQMTADATDRMVEVLRDALGGTNG